MKIRETDSGSPQINSLQREATLFSTGKYVNLETLKKSQYFGPKKYSDATYQGILRDGKREGKGLMKYNNGRIYEGEWCNDLRDGKGLETYPNGNSYEGEFKQGKAEGKGIYKWHNGEVYDGEWHQGLKHGDGVWKGIFNHKLRKEYTEILTLENGRAVRQRAMGCTFGKMVTNSGFKEGDRYEGEWKGCLKHGNGTDLFANGDVYIGQYRHGKE